MNRDREWEVEAIGRAAGRTKVCWEGFIKVGDKQWYGDSKLR